MPSAIRIENVDFGYPAQTVLRGVALTIPAGALVALTGANGTGKSTFIHTVAGLLPPLAGKISFATENAPAVAPTTEAAPAPTNASPAPKPPEPPTAPAAPAAAEFSATRPVIGLVGQVDALDAVYLFTGSEVVLAGARLARPPAAPLSRDARARAAEAIRAVGAEAFAARRFSEMSGGQRQRVLLARALALAPQILALDEPVSGVDAESRDAIAGLLAELRDTGAMTILLSSHDPAFWEPLATHRLQFEDGKMLF
ncbi:MAG: ATP-binding cassette domain-containing protein [Puniceicoccales bacterium]|jgi:ABC-type Mn2+/Zn2+ transport system ATPase subunit|nr:ATP-binding cassette domain-containing protein [Puniceicoccales bacterium]